MSTRNIGTRLHFRSALRAGAGVGVGRQRGQIVIFLVMAAIPIAVGIAYLFNSAEHLSRKVRVQDAADAAAIAQGTWTARALNVMATNNVALTQTAAINAIGAAVNLTTADLIQFFVREAARWTAVGVVACAAGAFLNPKCIEAGAKLAIALDGAWELEDVAALNVLAHPEFNEHAWAYARANQRIARDFEGFAERMQIDLAVENGLTAWPLLQAVGWRDPPSVAPVMRSTRLPVSPIDAGALVNGDIASDAFTVVWTGIRSVHSTGEDGTSDFPFPMARNFDEHGYEDRAPWPRARDSVKEQLEAAIDRANLLGWDDTVGEDPPDYEGCWDTSSTPPWLPMTCREGIPLGNPIPAPLYGPSQAPALDGDVAAWGITDILVYARAPRAAGYVNPSRFPNAVDMVYGLAKVRVYNSTAPDLYSSDWRAALVPVTSWRGNSRLPPELLAALQKLSRADPRLATSLRTLNSRELLRALSR